MSADVSLRERKKARTRVELMRAAIDLFVDRGYDATTVDDIVDRAGYSRMTFFRYFGAKEDVMFGDLPDRLAVASDNLDRRATTDPVEEVRQTLANGLVEHATFAPEIDVSAVELWFKEPALERRYLALHSAAERLVGDYLTEMWGPAQSLEARITATALIGVADAILRARLASPEEIRDAADRGFALLDRGLKSP